MNGGIVPQLNIYPASHGSMSGRHSMILFLFFRWCNLVSTSCSFLFSALNCALMMAVSAFPQGQLSRTGPVGSTDSQGRRGARSGGNLSVRPAPPRPCPADDRSDCRSDRSFVSHGSWPTLQLTAADAAAGKRHAAAPSSSPHWY